MLKVADKPMQDNTSAPPLFSASPAIERKTAIFWESRFDKYRSLRADQLASECITVTPEMAEWLLNNCNSKNRPLVRGNVTKYVNIIREGKWLLTSQGLSFSRERRLNNGQHRLHALVETGVPLRFNCVFGEDPSAFYVLDTQKTRGPADALAINGYQNDKILAAMVRIVSSLEKGITSLTRVDSEDTVAFVNDRRPLILDAISPGGRAYGKFKSASKSGLCAAWYWISSKTYYPNKVAGFWDGFCEGTNLPPKSPVLVARDDFATGRVSLDVRGSDTRALREVGTIVTAWNLHVRGRTSKQVRWSPAVPFPTVE
jgi:hypothetical protein